MKIPGGWKHPTDATADSDAQLEGQVRVLLQSEASLLNRGVELHFEEVRKLDRVLHVDVIGTGKSNEQLPVHSERYPVEIRFSYATCESCGLMSGGYHEAVLQIRADKRPVSDQEAEQILEMVTHRTVAEYGRDVKAFVTSVDRHRHGVDFKIGSEHLAHKIGDEIERAFLANRKENFKLVTEEHDGKRKYRVTIVLRLPEFEIGDFITVTGNPCEIRSIGQGVVTCYDMKTGKIFTISPKSSKWESAAMVAKCGARRSYTVVVACPHQPFQLMDTETFHTIEVEPEQFPFDISLGDTVYGVTIETVFYPLPSGNSQ